MITAYLEHGNEYKPSRGFMSAGSEAHTICMHVCTHVCMHGCMQSPVCLHIHERGRALVVAYRSGYNELVVGGEHWSCHMPEQVEAFFVVEGSKKQMQLEARRTHQAFLQEYGLDEVQVPFLKLDSSDWNHPFALAP